MSSSFLDAKSIKKQHLSSFNQSIISKLCILENSNKTFTKLEAISHKIEELLDGEEPATRR